MGEKRTRRRLSGRSTIISAVLADGFSTDLGPGYLNSAFRLHPGCQTSRIAYEECATQIHILPASHRFAVTIQALQALVRDITIP